MTKSPFKLLKNGKPDMRTIIAKSIFGDIAVSDL